MYALERCRPDGLSVEGAFSELLASKCLYDREPHNLAPFDLERLRVARGDFIPKCAENLFRPEIAGYLQHYDDCIQLTSEG